MSNATLTSPRLGRRRDAAQVLGVSESQVLKFEHQGLLRAIQIPGIRATRFDMEEVHALAEKWIREAQTA